MRLSIIKNISETKGVSIRSIAEKIGMSEQNLHRCIRVGQIQAHQLEIIAEMFNVPVGYFFDEEPVAGINNATIKGNNNVLAGRDNHIAAGKLNDCTKELVHLKALLSEKERTIQILMERK